MRVDGNKLLAQIIKPALLALPDPPVGTNRLKLVTKQPADIADYLPIIYGRKTTGSQNHPKFGEFGDFQLDHYATGLDGYDVAMDAAKLTDTLLYDAWDQQTVYEDGHVSSYECTVTPFDFPDSAMPDGVTRITAEYRLGLRPPPST
jgi:hypothetical protein